MAMIELTNSNLRSKSTSRLTQKAIATVGAIRARQRSASVGQRD